MDKEIEGKKKVVWSKLKRKKMSLKWVSGNIVNISENDKQNHWVAVHGNSSPPIFSIVPSSLLHTQAHFFLFQHSPSPLVFINPKYTENQSRERILKERERHTSSLGGA